MSDGVSGRKATTLWVLAFLLPISGCAPTPDEDVDPSSAELSAVDENSAARFEWETYEEALRRHQERYRKNHPEEGTLAGTAQKNQVAVTQADLADVPVWSDADIAEHFEASRDLRFMTTADRPSFQRRLSWLYPDDGCFARAELVNAKAQEAGKVRPYRLFSFGSLTVQTTNHPRGRVTWWYHTVPIVKSAASREVMVLDAAIDPRKPIPWKDWLLKQVTNLDNVKVSVCDGNAYSPSSPCTGSAAQTSSALRSQQTGYLLREWDRQVALARDPNQVLGNAPPWE